MKKKIIACALASAATLSITPAAFADDNDLIYLRQTVGDHEKSDRVKNQGSVDFDNKVLNAVLSADSLDYTTDDSLGYLLGFLLGFVSPAAALSSAGYLSYQFQVQQGLIRPLFAK